MNSLPYLFIDNACHLLRKSLLSEMAIGLSGSWSTIGSVHKEKRREFGFICKIKEDGSVNYRFSDASTDLYLLGMTVDDLNLTYDRITSFVSTSYRLPTPGNSNQVSVDTFMRYLRPTIALLVSNCSFGYEDPKNSGQNRFMFDAFKNCHGFDDIYGLHRSKEEHDFVAQQVEYGNIEKLTLEGGKELPETENLAKTLETFVRSTRFHELRVSGPLPNDFDLLALFVERALAGELKHGASIWRTMAAFDKCRVRALYPEFRHETTKLGGAFQTQILSSKVIFRLFSFPMKLSLQLLLKSDQRASGRLSSLFCCALQSCPLYWASTLDFKRKEVERQRFGQSAGNEDTIIKRMQR